MRLQAIEKRKQRDREIREQNKAANLKYAMDRIINPLTAEFRIFPPSGEQLKAKEEKAGSRLPGRARYLTAKYRKRSHREADGITKAQNARLAQQAEVPNDEAPPAIAATD
ncbi:hypothetical protein PG984_016226 [Apiospora sp. TS-2023a]